MTVNAQEFRNAMARLGAAVNIITSDGEAGKVGFTASAVCSVTDTPATLLICINRNSSSREALLANGVVCVNVLSAGQRPVSDIFAGATGVKGAARFEAAEWQTLATGAPALVGAIASIDCRISEVIEKGTHSIIFGEVQAIHLGEGHDSLIYWSRDYHEIQMRKAG
ncbi:flavin reductase [Acetobacteraceae bacterium H6797]|nr:flavin reductase [Acetobacteraceae bacterium H6797]